VQNWDRKKKYNTRKELLIVLITITPRKNRITNGFRIQVGGSTHSPNREQFYI
jgi:hypothetical protein